MSLVEPSIEQQLGSHIDDTGLHQILADPPWHPPSSTQHVFR